MIPAIPDFTRARVLVAGDVMLDRYWTGPTQRISPEAPVPVVRIQKNESRPGGAANVALNTAALGVKTRLLGVVGRDEPAKLLRDGLDGQGVVTAFLESQDKPTITKLRVLSRNQQLIRLDFEDNFAVLESAGIEQAFEAALDGSGALVLSDYGKGTLAQVGSLIRVAREHRVPIVVDPKGTDFGRYCGATVLTPNLAEFEAVVGHCSDEAALRERGEALREALDLEALLVTRSERGMTLLQKGQVPLDLATRARDVFDVTGAGDTVVAVLGAGLACGLSLADATAFANLAAGVVVGKLGTATVSIDELRGVLGTAH